MRPCWWAVWGLSPGPGETPPGDRWQLAFLPSRSVGRRNNRERLASRRNTRTRSGPGGGWRVGIKPGAKSWGHRVLRTFGE